MSKPAWIPAEPRIVSCAAEAFAAPDRLSSKAAGLVKINGKSNYSAAAYREGMGWANETAADKDASIGRTGTY